MLQSDLRLAVSKSSFTCGVMSALSLRRSSSSKFILYTTWLDTILALGGTICRGTILTVLIYLYFSELFALIIALCSNTCA